MHASQLSKLIMAGSEIRFSCWGTNWSLYNFSAPLWRLSQLREREKHFSSRTRGVGGAESLLDTPAWSQTRFAAYVMSERGAAQKFFYTLHCLRVCPWKQDRRLQKPVGVTQASVASWQAGSESHCSTHLDLYVVGSTLDSICIVQVISLLTQIFQQWFTRRKRITWLTRPITRFFTYGWFILRLSFHMSHSNIENNIRVGKVQNSFLFPLKLSCCRKWTILIF